MWSRDHGLDLKTISRPQTCNLGLGREPSGLNSRTFHSRYRMYGGDITDVNYRAIALANVEPKLLESIILDKVNMDNEKKRALRETQTLRAGCSNAEPNIFAPPQTPFPGAQNGQNLISWKWSLPLPTNPVW